MRRRNTRVQRRQRVPQPRTRRARKTAETKRGPRCNHLPPRSLCPRDSIITMVSLSLSLFLFLSFPPFLLHKNRTSKPLSVSLFSVCLYFDRCTRVYVRRFAWIRAWMLGFMEHSFQGIDRLTLKKCWLYRKMYRCSRWTRGDKLERSRG